MDSTNEIMVLTVYVVRRRGTLENLCIWWRWQIVYKEAIYQVLDKGGLLKR